MKKDHAPDQIALEVLTHEMRQSFIESYAIFLDTWHLDSTPELAAVYYNARAMKIADASVMDAKLHMEYTLLQGLSKLNYQEALKSVTDLIDKEN